MTNLKQEILIVSFFTLVSPIAGWIPSPHHSARGSLPNGGKIWALLVAGSKGYFNYRHQADICHAYQLLRSNGIPESQIITMMYDDVAASPENPTPNTIINHPGGPNVYEGVSIDYSGDDVNSTNFLAVLTGRRDALQGNGSGRVINSGPNDHIFVNFVDHGAPGFLCFPNDELHAKLLEETLQTMFFEKRFGKMVWYVEACESGSMFDDILPDNTNIFVMTAADPRESSYACYYDKLRGTYLGDVFSVNWMEDSDVGNLNKETIHHQFEKVRTKTNSSHVEEYGDLDIGSFPLSSFQGYGAQAKVGVSQRLPAIEDAVSSREVPLAVLKLQSMSAVDRMAKKKLEHKTWRLLKLRRLLDITMFKFALKVAGGDEVKSTSLLKSTNKLTLSKLDCYEKVVKYFSKRCFKISENPYVLTKMQIFINLCSVSWSNAAIGMKAMDEVCVNDGQQAKIL